MSWVHAKVGVIFNQSLHICYVHVFFHTFTHYIKFFKLSSTQIFSADSVNMIEKIHWCYIESDYGNLFLD